MDGTVSMSMSLAEGIANRDIRELKNKEHGVGQLYAIMSCGGRQLSGKKRQKSFEELLADFKGYWINDVGDGKRNSRRYNYVLWELNERGGLDRIDVKITKNSLEVTPVAFGVSFHALARIIYRRRLEKLSDVQKELNHHLEMHSLVVNQVMHSDKSRNVRTLNGFFIVKMFDDGCIRATTWVDAEKGTGNQLELNSNLYTTICGMAESRGLEVLDYLKYCIEFTALGEHKPFRNAYIKQGGDVGDLDAMAQFYERRIIELTDEVAKSEEEEYA